MTVTLHHEYDADGPYTVLFGADARLDPISYCYLVGETEPHYPVPALYDVYPDQEYLVMMYEHALLASEEQRFEDKIAQLELEIEELMK